MGNATQRKNRLIVIMGKSGAGKNTILATLLERFPDLKRGVTTTSRPPRKNEIQGVDYNFVSKAEFLEKLEKDEFLETQEVRAVENGEPVIWYYGSEKKVLDINIQSCIIILTPPGLKKMKKLMGDSILSIYVEVPYVQRKSRVISRSGQFNELEWTYRVSDDDYVFENVERIVDYIVVNDVLENCVKQIENILKWHA